MIDTGPQWRTQTTSQENSMRTVVIFAGLFAIVSITGCGGGSVGHEFYESEDYSGQRTRIHVQAHDEPSDGYRVVEGSPVNLHIHTASGQSICIEISTER